MEEKVNPGESLCEAGKGVFLPYYRYDSGCGTQERDLPTVFSSSISSIKRIYGMERMIDILKALGNDKLDRSAYYYWSGSRRGKGVSELSASDMLPLWKARMPES